MDNIGLPKKQSAFAETILTNDGQPKVGTDMYFLLEEAKKDARREGYIDGLKYSLNFFKNCLKKLVYFDVDDSDELNKEYKKIPESYKELRKYLECLTYYIKNLKTQINNTNKNNYREQTHKMVLHTEYVLRKKRGEIINTLLGKKLKQYSPNERPVTVKKTTTEKKEKPILDPTDVLLNVEISDEKE